MAMLADSSKPGEPYGTMLRQFVGAALVDYREDVGLPAIAGCE